jgi:glycosyltransferase involved in cell wall biosynthesis
MNVMIYHAPYPLDSNAMSASGIRPVRMLEAFRELGYRVLEVTGNSKQRKLAIGSVKEFVADGGIVDFAYSESSTMPTAITDAHHLPLHPFLDAAFFRYLRHHDIPVGVFYRDIYWKFPEYLHSVNRIVALGTRALYRFDLFVYRLWVDRLYLPSLKMGVEVPIVKPAQHEALPPGCTTLDPVGDPDDDLTIFYVGGIGDYYRLHEGMRAVGQVDGVRLIICTSKAQWDDLASDYEDIVNTSVDIVHASGRDLEVYYRRATIGSLFLEPIQYREFASPMKLYEYIGHGRPVIASKGTLSGTFVAEHNLGWTIPYSADALTELLNQLLENPDEVKSITEHVREERHAHTWLARARQVAGGLTRTRLEREIP